MQCKWIGTGVQKASQNKSILVNYIQGHLNSYDSSAWNWLKRIIHYYLL